MKGLQERTDDGIFLVIKHGGICQESKHPREGFSPIEVSNVRTGDKTIKYIKRYKGVEALIKKIEWYDREFDDTRFMGWKLVLDADGTPCTLDLPFESRVGSRFMKLAEMIDYSQPVEFSAWKGPDDKTAFAVKQNGENVPQRYTREDPGDCPPPVQGFNKKWNFDAQKQFLHERMINVVVPKVQALHNHSAPAEKEHEPGAASNGNGNHSKVLDDIKKTVKALAGSKEADGATKAELLTNYFGTASWSEIEKMDEKLLVQTYQKLDDLIPF